MAQVIHLFTKSFYLERINMLNQMKNYSSDNVHIITKFHLNTHSALVFRKHPVVTVGGLPMSATRTLLGNIFD